VPRPPRDQSGGIRHITCRGNRRQAVFHDDADRRRFVQLLERVCARCEWQVVAWCLMTNHFHLVVDVPAGTISSGMQRLCGDYAQEFNWLHDFTGHLFEGRFRAGPVSDERHLFKAIRYVDLNPERAGITVAEWWVWSSFRAHLGLEPPRPFHDTSWVRRLGAQPDSAVAAYARFVDDARRRDSQTGHARGLTPDMSR
jgi:REP element-mobilizing transposase RayT